MERVQTSPDEEFRVRSVVIKYFLEDDTMLVYEPTVENSGLQQGMRLKRQRIPKTKDGAYYLWTDLNIGVDLEIFGVKYHITQCDAFTKVQQLLSLCLMLLLFCLLGRIKCSICSSQFNI